jgi:hypothetical protein
MYLSRDRISQKLLLEIKEMDFKNGIKNVHAAGYNGSRIFISVVSP